MNAKRNDKGAMTAITHPNATAEMPLQFHDNIITEARTVAKDVVDVKENVSLERLTIQAVPLVGYMGKGTERLQKMGQQFEAENEGILTPTQVRWLANPHTIWERWPNREIDTSSVVFIVKGCRVAQILMKKGIKAAGVWYPVEKYTNEEPNSRCELC